MTLTLYCTSLTSLLRALGSQIKYFCCRHHWMTSPGMHGRFPKLDSFVLPTLEFLSSSVPTATEHIRLSIDHLTSSSNHLTSISVLSFCVKKLMHELLQNLWTTTSPFTKYKAITAPHLTPPLHRHPHHYQVNQTLTDLPCHHEFIQGLDISMDPLLNLIRDQRIQRRNRKQQ